MTTTATVANKVGLCRTCYNPKYKRKCYCGYGSFHCIAINRNCENVGEPNYFYDGIQSGFHFTGPENVAGKVNDALYFINYRPSGITEKQAIQ